MPKPIPYTQAEIRQLLTYSPWTGEFYWLARENAPCGWNHKNAGKRAGSPNSSGHVSIYIAGSPYLAHRLAFLWMTGEVPNEVDHSDVLPANNPWRNLRPCSRGENTMNRRKFTNNTSGYKGVHYKRANGRWGAVIQVDGIQRHIGYFATAEEAYAAYIAAAEEHHGSFARFS